MSGLRKGKQVARITIYVPKALKEKMDSLEARPNWSAVAQGAFRRGVRARRGEAWSGWARRGKAGAAR